ncbi:SPRY domain-containing protein [Azospirillum lipoferum]|uniref:B30.2/SPRY domain-containing protein n=1 Tax=Azospirillum lipoferum (strain 4B) TaxID=862719 RepID=G7ZAF8_AZOL4|nr:SPRY domain-containing protein [Azospirillum lipoferum]CBS88726.1 protein of unknown function [Azospirillum lipoferum 4B]
MTTLATMLAAALRLLGYYNGNDYSADNPGGMSGVGGMATNWEPCIQDIGTVANGVGEVAGTIAAAQSTIALVWDAATAAADPGAGKLRATTATPALGSYSLLVSATDSAGAGIGAMLSELGSSSSATKARARLVAVGDASKYLDLQVTGVSGAGAYRTVAVTCIGGPGGFGAGDAIALGWVRSGDKGDAGGATLPAGTLAAPGLAVSGDSNTGLAQVGGADSLSMVGGGAEVIRASPNAAKVYGALTVGDRGDGFGSALTLTPGSGPDWHVYSRAGDGALVVFHHKNRLGTTVATEVMVLKDGDIVDFARRPTVGGLPISGGFTPATLSASYTVLSTDAGKLIECTAGLTLALTAAAMAGNGFTFAAWNNSTGAVIVDPSGSELINGGSTLTLLAGQWAIITCTASAWKALTQTTRSSCVLSSTDKESGLVITNGGLTASVASGGAMQSGRGTVALSGQKYFEVALDIVATSGLTAIVGIATAAATFGSTFGLATSANGYGFASDTGNKLNNSSQSAYSSSWGTAGHVVGVAYDDVSTPGTVKVWLSINGVWQASGNPATGANPAFSISAATFYPAITLKNGGQATARFTAAQWSYSAPAGFTQIS